MLRGMRFCSGCLLLLLQSMVSACYEYAPAPTTPGPGTSLLLELNDRGRVGLGESIGPSGQLVEGTVAGISDSAFALRVVRVGYMNGQSNKWNGEPLMVAKDFVARVTERRFSRARTWLAASAFSLAAGAFIASRGLLGLGSERTKGGGKPPPTQ